MKTFLAEVCNVPFDSMVLHTILSAMYTIRSSEQTYLPALHCLITSNSQDLYRSTLEDLSLSVPNFHPSVLCQTVTAARNAVTLIYPDIQLYECWLTSPANMAETQKLGLSESFIVLPKSRNSLDN